MKSSRTECSVDPQAPALAPGAVGRRQFLGVAAMAGALGLVGCSLKRAALPQRTFLLSAPASPAGSIPADREPAGVLLVRPVRVAPAFDARAFVIRRGEAEYVSDAYHGFLLSPGPMLTEALAGWVRGLGVFREVTTGGSQVAPSHALECDVEALYGDYHEPAALKAILSVGFRFLHPLMGAASPVLWRRTDAQAVALPRAGADELVAGWNEALGRVCRGLDAGLFQRPAERPGAQA